MVVSLWYNNPIVYLCGINMLSRHCIECGYYTGKPNSWVEGIGAIFICSRCKSGWDEQDIADFKAERRMGA
jgi:hypothetical protein